MREESFISRLCFLLLSPPEKSCSAAELRGAPAPQRTGVHHLVSSGLLCTLKPVAEFT